VGSWLNQLSWFELQQLTICQINRVISRSLFRDNISLSYDIVFVTTTNNSGNIIIMGCLLPVVQIMIMFFCVCWHWLSNPESFAVEMWPKL